jgi:hypothetical protein
MKNISRRIVLVTAVVAGVALLIGITGSVFARVGGPFGWGIGGMMGRNSSSVTPMGGRMNGDAMVQMMGSGGMMGYTRTLQPGAMHGQMGSMMAGGMMSNTVYHRPGMMMGFGSSNLLGVKPLSVDQATRAVKDYLAKQGNTDLALAEIMIFDNNAYARVTEKSTGAGALELLVDPVTQAVYPEPGPNMMWNTKYSPMRDMMAGMMGGTPAREVTTAMPVSAADALQAAQAYLDQNLPGAKTAEDADTFYGYYTIDILRDGKVVGMMSVNGYTSQVFMHTWHGNFVEMSESGR